MKNSNSILVVGGSGATGKILVEQLLKRDQNVKIIVRSPEKLPESWHDNDLLTLVHAEISVISEAELTEHVKDCYAVASCLGHNLSMKGIYGKPRKLVTDAVRKLCKAVKKSGSDIKPVKFVLMNTTGNSNRDLKEPISTGQKIVIGLLRLLLPPHVDNEKAADYLRTQIGQEDDLLEWAAVRPDSLINEDKVTEYEIYPSPIRSAIFDAGKTSRINVGHFMADLITNNEIWKKWKGQMPVIYNK